MGAILLPLLLQMAPTLIGLIAKNHDPIQAALANVTGGQPNPVSGLLGLLGGGLTGSSDPEVVVQLKRISTALEALVAKNANPQPVT